ncbi:hypothetical protein NW762_010491 [Fusarium torreyae]|uniref:Uncharacterized protein n=1 Tax=Fusarium torreyae TaxID=1237075 RepID=A0A9W8RSW7_9HYPO|nr:hypothetical protein NW762_010491 [Fusarium torreyae]
MASNNQNVEPPEPEPRLEFRSHKGRVDCAQPRITIPRPRTDNEFGVVCHMSFFAFKTPEDETIVSTLVAGFQIIQRNMCPLLAGDMVKFLVDAWKEENQPRSHHGKPPAAHPYYKRLKGTEGNIKHLSYAYWFYLAACWGPDHPQLRGIRKEMSELWGAVFPPNMIVYPGYLSTERQKKLFGGVPTALFNEPNVQEQSGDEQSHDTVMQKRVRQLKQTIEDTPIEGLAGVIGDLPIILTKASSVNDTSELDELKLQLAATRKDLKETLGQVEGLQQELSDLRISSDNTIQQLQRDVDANKGALKVVDAKYLKMSTSETLLGGRVDAWEEKLEDMDKRVEKAVETCALVLGILSAPGGDKRKRGDEA